MTTATATESLPCAALYYRESGSDKEYHVRIEAKEDGFVVNFAYGRRGAALTLVLPRERRLLRIIERLTLRNGVFVTE